MTVFTTTSHILGNFVLVTASFVILLVLIRVFAWKNITGIFDERAKKIASELDAAAAKQQEAVELVKQRQQELTESRIESQKLVQEAVERAKFEKKHILEQAEAEVQALKEKAQIEIANEKQEAKETIRLQVAQLAVDLAGKIILQDLDEQAHRELVDRYIDKLGDK